MSKRTSSPNGAKQATKKSRSSATPLDTKCINTVRCLAADMVQKANSGHPGAPMGLAPIAYVLWTKVMRYNPASPKWMNRDRFILSNGHGCALQYIMLHLAGYKVSMEDLQNFRQLGSITPGHPENHVTEGIEVTTGPLGQGVANGVGMAIAQAHLAATYNKPGFDLFDSHIYVICGDGCHMEGLSGEAASLAGHLGLANLTLIYDDNKISIDGPTSLSFTEDVQKRYEAYGWHTVVVEGGDDDVAEMERALAACKQERTRPSIVLLRTTIGFGSSKAGSEKSHGAPLGADDLANTKEKLGMARDATFVVPDEVRAVYAACSEAGAAAESAWGALFDRYSKQFPGEAAEITRRFSNQLPAGWKDALPSFSPADKPIATRKLHQKVLDKLAGIMPEIIGGSADLTPSNMTALTGNVDFQRATPEGRYIRFGVREHAMAAICNGLTAYGGFLPYHATFLNFLSYNWPSIRLAALSQLRTIAIMTHDSIGLGEDGPTHQPVEILPLARACPNLLTIRPADGQETVGAYVLSLERAATPSVHCYSRQDVPHLEGSSVDGVARGAYVLQEPAGGGNPDVVLMGTGSETHLCVDAAKQLAAAGIKARVVSAPAITLLDAQPVAYRAQVLPVGVPVISVEASSGFGWHRYSHTNIGMSTFGASAPYQHLYKHFGFTVDNIAAKATEAVRSSNAYFKSPLAIHA